MEPIPSSAAIEQFLGANMWIIIGLFVANLFRSTLDSAIAGLMVFMGNDYNEDDRVFIDGKPGCIVRVNLWKTTFYMYDVDEDGVVTSGRKMSIDNTELKSVRISKPLGKLDLTPHNWEK